MVPVIGITSSYDEDTGKITVSKYYIQAVEAAGGLPLVLPCIISKKLCGILLNSIDGLLLSGGVDVDPLLFGEEPHPALGQISPQRDQFELALVQGVLNRDMPILAICRGIQVLNIAAGGNVLQDIGTAVNNPLKHDQSAPRWYGTHTIKTLPDSKLYSILGDKIVVNSFHHQAVDKVAEGFQATAWSADGVVEGIESTSHKFVVGVQCHPECMWEEEPRILELFKEFVLATKRDKILT